MKIVRWILSIVVAVWGLFTFATVSKNALFAIAGILTLAVAALFCPALDNTLKNIKNKKAVIAVLIIAILVIYYFVGGQLR